MLFKSTETGAFTAGSKFSIYAFQIVTASESAFQSFVQFKTALGGSGRNPVHSAFSLLTKMSGTVMEIHIWLSVVASILMALHQESISANTGISSP